MVAAVGDGDSKGVDRKRSRSSGGDGEGRGHDGRCGAARERDDGSSGGSWSIERHGCGDAGAASDAGGAEGERRDQWQHREQIWPGVAGGEFVRGVRVIGGDDVRADREAAGGQRGDAGDGRHGAQRDGAVGESDEALRAYMPAVAVTVAVRISVVPKATGLAGEKARVTAVGTGPEPAVEPGMPLMSTAPERLAMATS